MSFQVVLRMETNDSHQKMWREQPNIGFKIEPALAGFAFLEPAK